MDIASRIRHPNLLQFIGAITEDSPIILTELMPTSLRKELEKSGPLSYQAILSISLDVACALNYLHLLKPHPIIHRDVSSANVLLQPMGGYDNSLRAKLSDYGSANLSATCWKNYPPWQSIICHTRSKQSKKSLSCNGCLQLWCIIVRDNIISFTIANREDKND